MNIELCTEVQHFESPHSVKHTKVDRRVGGDRETETEREVERERGREGETETETERRLKRIVLCRNVGEK